MLSNYIYFLCDIIIVVSGPQRAAAHDAAAANPQHSRTRNLFVHLTPIEPAMSDPEAQEDEIGALLRSIEVISWMETCGALG